jgi:hypothetical protein
MKLIRHEPYFVLATTAAGLTLSALSAAFPVALILPSLISYTTASPLIYLMWLIVIAELFSLKPAGIMTLVILLPWLTSRLFKKRAPVDFSFSFVTLVVTTALLQFVALFLPEAIARSYLPAAPLSSVIGALGLVPWSLTFWLLPPALLVYAAAILIRFNRA